MGARKLEELLVWRLGCELSDRVSDIIALPAVQRVRKLCEQLGDAADSVTGNIAEGFGRYRPREFAVFARYAKASAFEIRGHVREAHTRKLIDVQTFTETSNPARRTAIALIHLIRYLENCPPDGPPPRDEEPNG